MDVPKVRLVDDDEIIRTLLRHALGSLASGRLRPNSVGVLPILHDLSVGTLVTVGHARDELSCPVIGVIPPCGAEKENLNALKIGVPVIHFAPSSAAAVADAELGARLMVDRILALTFWLP